ncbi:galactinol--sucrose galactosyltransferase [Cajanus cajan]|uniref:galactinol--sucrose galactosyltransferase n=1 Tax=Cajanus cajan TaxID=3821 RepID=A0A151SJ87_CAJCA|nr:galactinol--sucrose galactosyltransferase [Cajanus cajan]KYP54843.1 putative glycosyltransferase At1g55740 family [Cajanus cajan]
MAPSMKKASPSSLVTKHVNGFNPSPFTLSESTLKVNGHVILSHVPQNITLTPCTHDNTTTGCFLGFRAPSPKSRHVAPMGLLQNINFTSIFRFKVWWTTLWAGSNGRDLETETQFLMLQSSPSPNQSPRPYVLFLPIIEGPFRASLEPGPGDNVSVCVESGSSHVAGSTFDGVVYMQAGEDPFTLVKDATRVVKAWLGSFNLVEEKRVPGVVDKFGWCTWDAFYLTVEPEGVKQGVKGLAEGGCPPGFVLIDDGWQCISHDKDPEAEGMNQTVAGEQMPCRLISYQENYKFRDYGEGEGLKGFVRDLKEGFGVEYVYVWHALCGYWGGVRPGVKGMAEATVEEVRLSEGLKGTMEDLAVDKIVQNRVGVVPPDHVAEMYEGLHSHLESSGIDGVKVDVIHLLEMVCEKYGGRVDMAKAYYKALTASVRKHFKGNGVIASMEHCNDFMLLGTEAISLGRVGDDFWCTDPYGDPNGTYWLQGCHMVHCAYNSLWMGNFIHPDWDMFQSTHPCAAFHAASRAMSGGPIYISDKVRNHNFELLKTLVLPDGSILRCEHYALPTRDCLFADPLHDGKTMLKIWNLNKHTGVLGVFNCQGGGWFREIRSNKCAAEFSHRVSTKTNPKDIEWNSGKNPISIEGVQLFALYFSQAKKLILSAPSDSEEVSLEPFHFELITVSPVTVLPGKSIKFAPIGLVNMLNTGGAVQSLAFDEAHNLVEVGVRGKGEMRVYASERPSTCRIDGKEVDFEYEESMVKIQVPWPGSSKLSTVQYAF